GGINASNVQRVLFQTASAQKQLDGVAVVSAIVAADDARQAASHLRELVRKPPLFAASSSKPALSQQDIRIKAPELIKRMA
ncbi:UNVERIFIED_CONTAM: hypothetical protein NY603_37625, partial [Bacteroidetes bacterium 56_B9]